MVSKDSGQQSLNLGRVQIVCEGYAKAALGLEGKILSYPMQGTEEVMDDPPADGQGEHGAIDPEVGGDVSAAEPRE